MKTRNILYTALLSITLTGLFCSCGQGGKTGALTWKLKDGTLTISGQGAMPNYGNIVYKNGESHLEDGCDEVIPWWTLSSEITSVVIENGVQNIGNKAFSNLYNLRFVSIPASVTNIGKNAFSGCSSLNNITIPNSIISIDKFAFSNCSNLTDVVIGENTKIGSFAFLNSPFGKQYEKPKNNVKYEDLTEEEKRQVDEIKNVLIEQLK